MATVNTAELLSNNAAGVSRPIAPGTNGAVKLARHAAPTAPRVDLHTLYSTLKELVGDKWQRYMAIVAEFLLGGCNQAELTRGLDPILQHDPAKEHAHNQLVCALLYNSSRDPPEPGVASWVSANDKPTSTSKPVSGDVAEQRLKAAIMHLPPRDRHRIKSIQDEQADNLASRYKESHATMTVRPPEAVGASAGGFNKTNWELEIRKRYAQSLFAESNEFPDREAVQSRMVPICYEMGVGGGASSGSAEYLNLAAETYVKKLLGDIFGAVWRDGPGLVKTAAFKRKVEREEAAWVAGGSNSLGLGGDVQNGGGDAAAAAAAAALASGTVVRNAAGLLPAEVEAAEGRKQFDMADFRHALRTADGYTQQNPLTAARIAAGWTGTAADWYDDGDDGDGADDHAGNNGVYANGRFNGSGASTNGVHGSGSGTAVVNGTGANGVSASSASGAQAPRMNGVVAGAKAKQKGKEAATATAAKDSNEMEIDAVQQPSLDDLGWPGAGPADREALDSLLDECLGP